MANTEGALKLSITEAEKAFEERIMKLGGDPELQQAAMLQRALIRPWLEWLSRAQKDPEVMVKAVVNVMSEMVGQIIHNYNLPENEAATFAEQIGKIIAEQSLHYGLKGKATVGIKMKSVEN